jgi:hypothetical protein
MAHRRPTWPRRAGARLQGLAVALLPGLLLGLLLLGLLLPGQGAATVPADPLAIRVGLHVRNIYGLSLAEQTFKAEGWYWLRVPVAVQDLIERRGIKPPELVEFVNQVDNWDGLIEAVDSDAPSADGSRLFSFRFAAAFYVPEIDQRRSPFELIRLPLILEISPEALADPATRVRLQPESARGGLLGDYSSLYGYELRGVSIGAAEHRYPTTFGTASDSTYSRLQMLVTYAPNTWAMVMQWILPLLLVLSLVLLAPSLEGSLGDARLAIPPTALLTLVFLQQTYKAEMPPTSYLTFLDQLYTYGYAVSVGLFVLFLWGSNQLESAPANQRERVMRRINQVDLRFQMGGLLALALVALVAWFR